MSSASGLGIIRIDLSRGDHTVLTDAEAARQEMLDYIEMFHNPDAQGPQEQDAVARAI